MHFVLVCLISGIGLQTPPTRFPGLPKYPKVSKVSTVTGGVKPGSKVTGTSSDARFRRVEYLPVAMRLFVRANCDATVDQGELIEKAKAMTIQQGPVVEIDWEKVNPDKDVMYYAVIVADKRYTDYKLVAENGVYVVASHRVHNKPKWSVKRIRVANQAACVNESKMENRALYVAIRNMLGVENTQHVAKMYEDTDPSKLNF